MLARACGRTDLDLLSELCPVLCVIELLIASRLRVSTNNQRQSLSVCSYYSSRVTRAHTVPISDARLGAFDGA